MKLIATTNAWSDCYNSAMTKYPGGMDKNAYEAKAINSCNKSHPVAEANKTNSIGKPWMVLALLTVLGGGGFLLYRSQTA